MEEQRRKQAAKIVTLTVAIDNMTKSFAKSQYPVKPKEDRKPKKGKGKSEKQGGKGYAEWKATLPKPGELKEKTVKGCNYFWCPNHGKVGLWVAHKPTEYKLKDEKQDGEKEVRRRKMKGKAVESQASSQAQNLPPL